MSTAFLHITDVHKSYHPEAGPVEVLKGAGLRVEAGQAVAIVGPSGSGKSTLLSLLAGLQQPDSGTIEIAGQRLTSLTAPELETFRTRHIGIVFQHHHLLWQCTALENVLLPTLALNQDPPSARQRALELLERVGLAGRADHFPAQLSGGEQHRVAIARALIGRPALVLADEPTGFLEPARGNEIVHLLTAGREYTLITVTHADYVAGAMDCVYTLDRGTLVRR
jgi:ABC-type lipoprotein export system ATPase subunit